MSFAFGGKLEGQLVESRPAGPEFTIGDNEQSKGDIVAREVHARIPNLPADRGPPKSEIESCFQSARTGNSGTPDDRR